MLAQKTGASLSSVQLSLSLGSNYTKLASPGTRICGREVYTGLTRTSQLENFTITLLIMGSTASSREVAKEVKDQSVQIKEDC